MIILFTFLELYVTCVSKYIAWVKFFITLCFWKVINMKQASLKSKRNSYLSLMYSSGPYNVKTSILIRSPKLSNTEPSQYLDVWSFSNIKCCKIEYVHSSIIRLMVLSLSLYTQCFFYGALDRYLYLNISRFLYILLSSFVHVNDPSWQDAFRFVLPFKLEILLLIYWRHQGKHFMIKYKWQFFSHVFTFFPRFCFTILFLFQLMRLMFFHFPQSFV